MLLSHVIPCSGYASHYKSTCICSNATPLLKPKGGGGGGERDITYTVKMKGMMRAADITKKQNPGDILLVAG